MAIAGQGGVPTTATAVVMNVAVTDTTAPSFLAVYPSDKTYPGVSNLNWTAGLTVPNRVMVPLGPDGKVTLFNWAGSADVVIDINGYFTSSGGAVFTGLTPARILDTRPGDQYGPYATPFGPSTTRPLAVTGVGNVPAAGVSAVVLNVAVTDADATSFLTAYPAGVTQPVASDLNWVAGRTVPNFVVVQVGTGGQIDLYNALGRVDVVADVVGYYIVPSVSPTQLQVTVSDLPSGTAANVTVSGPAPAVTTYQLTGNQTLAVPAGQYAITAQPVVVGSDTYYPTITPATVTLQAGATAQAAVDYLTIIPSTSKVLSTAAVATLTSVSPDNSTLVFSTSSALPPIAPGDILGAGVSTQTPDGLLRKVTAVSTQGTQVTVTTAAATLLDAAPRGGFDVQATLTANNVQGAAGRPAAAGSGAPLLQNIKSNLSCQAGGTAEVTGSISVVPSFHFAPQWGLFPPSVTQVTFTGTVDETLALTASASANASCTLDETPLLPQPIRFAPIVVDVGIPVVIVPTLQFYLSANAQGELTITAGATQDATVTAGVDYANGTFTPVQDFHNSFTDSLSAVSALDAGLGGSVRTTLTLLFYDAAGPNVNVDGSMKFTVTPGQTPWCSLDAGLGAGAGLVVPILNLNYTNPSIFSHDFPLAACTSPPPQGSITVSQSVVGPAPSSPWALSGDLGSFTLPAAGGSKTVQSLAAGSYTMTETPQSGYTLAASCNNGATGTTSVTVSLAAGQNVTCTFSATQGSSSLPTVTQVAPSSGPPTGGTTVTIRGANFTGATAVAFGATPAASFTVTSPTTITAVSPAEPAGTVDVRVTAPSGTSAAIRPADQFTFGTGGPGSGPWPMFHHDLQHTGRSPAVGPSAATVRWRYQTDSPVASSSAIGEDGTIYVGSDDYYIYAIKPGGGLKWRYQTGNEVSSSPAIGADGTVYVGAWDGYVYALNPDGSLKWRYQAGGIGARRRAGPCGSYAGSDTGAMPTRP